MVTVPSFLLRKLYVRGSLKNTGKSVQFLLRNTLGSGYAEEMLPLTVDGQHMPSEQCFFTVNGETRAFDGVTRENPFTLALNRDVVVTLAQTTLTGEAHTIGIGFKVPGLGALRFDFTDIVAAASGTGDG